MAEGDQINIKPHFGETLPCVGEAGDLYVFTPVGEKDRDLKADGSATLWFCTKGSEGDKSHAVWVRVLLEGEWPCGVLPPKPPDYPDLPKKG